MFSLEGVVAVADAGWVKDENRAEGLSEAGGLCKEFSLDVVDNRRVFPGEKLADSKQSFSSPSGGDNQEVSEFPAGFGCRDSKDLTEMSNA